MDEVTYCHIKNYQMPILKPTNPGNDYGLYKGSAQNHDFVIQNVIEVLNIIGDFICFIFTIVSSSLQ